MSVFKNKTAQREGFAIDTLIGPDMTVRGDRVAAHGGLVAQVDHGWRRWFGGDVVCGPGKSDGAGDRGRGHGQNSAE